MEPDTSVVYTENFMNKYKEIFNNDKIFYRPIFSVFKNNENIFQRCKISLLKIKKIKIFIDIFIGFRYIEKPKDLVYYINITARYFKTTIKSFDLLINR